MTVLLLLLWIVIESKCSNAKNVESVHFGVNSSKRVLSKMLRRTCKSQVVLLCVVVVALSELGDMSVAVSACWAYYRRQGVAGLGNPRPSEAPLF